MAVSAFLFREAFPQPALDHRRTPGSLRHLAERHAVAACGVSVRPNRCPARVVSGESSLARLGRALRATVLLGLLVGVFDFVMNFLQMAVSRTELGWRPDLVILAAAVLVITVLGSRAAVRTPL